jgi:hypothetical protein
MNDYKEAQASIACGQPPARVARLLALAIRFERMLAGGTVSNLAELAQLGHVSRARMTQIMNLRKLAPAIQEDLLFERCSAGTRPVAEYKLRSIVAEPSWERQQRLYRALQAVASPAAADQRGERGHRAEGPMPNRTGGAAVKLPVRTCARPLAGKSVSSGPSSCPRSR